jgi:hypothetical protein
VSRLSVSIRLFANLFPRTLSRQSLLYSTLIARLQVEGVTLHLLNDVLGLNFALESPKRIFHRFAFLQSNFCHAHHLPNEDGFSFTVNSTISIPKKNVVAFILRALLRDSRFDVPAVIKNGFHEDDPRFYRLRNGTPAKKGPRKDDGEMRKGLPKVSPLRRH